MYCGYVLVFLIFFFTIYYSLLLLFLFSLFYYFSLVQFWFFSNRCWSVSIFVWFGYIHGPGAPWITPLHECRDVWHWTNFCLMIKSQCVLTRSIFVSMCRLLDIIWHPVAILAWGISLIWCLKVKETILA